MQREQLFPIVISTCVGMAVGLGVSWWHTNVVAQSLYDELKQRPPVVIFSMEDANKAAYKLDPERRKKAVDDTAAMISRMLEQGYIVLERNAIIAAPPEFALQTEAPADQGDKK